METTNKTMNMMANLKENYAAYMLLSMIIIVIIAALWYYYYMRNLVNRECNNMNTFFHHNMVTYKAIHYSNSNPYLVIV
jgi:hypothetical protein